MADPEVSVIIPGHNCAPFIAETLESALGQTFQNIEVIFVDDGSTDGTEAVVHRFRDRVRYLHLPTASGGPSRGRNVGIQESRGRFIALLDHDDLWEPHKIERQLEPFNRDPALGLVYSNCWIQDGSDAGNRRLDPNWRPRRGQVLADLLTENFIPCLTAMFPRRVYDKIGPFHEDLIITEDWEFFLRLAMAYPVEYLAEPLATYRRHAANLSRDVPRQYHEVLLTQRYLHRHAPGAVRPYRLTMLRFRAAWTLTLARHYRRHGSLLRSIPFYGLAAARRRKADLLMFSARAEHPPTGGGHGS